MRGKLRIAFLGWGGHVHLERWASCFARMGHEVHILSISGFGQYPEGVVQHRIGLEGRAARWRKIRLAWLLWRINPDVVHVHWAGFAHLVAGVWKGPLVVTAWGSDIYRLSKLPSQVVERVTQGLRAAQLITCDSRDLAATIASFLEPHLPRIEVVQWGVDTESFRHVGPNNPFASELATAGRPVVFSARSFSAVYNHETIVEAFARVREATPEVMLLMKDYKGDPAYRAKIAALVSKLGLLDSVRIVDTVPYARMRELYSLSAITVSVPLSDATPMALFEAMACESVPVVSDLPSLREWIADGANGFLVAPMDVDALTDRIIKLLTNADLRRDIATRNLEVVNSRAGQHTNMMRMEGMLLELTRRTDRSLPP
jgi:glycosyltransferase involved in cell wall biosynthesis